MITLNVDYLNCRFINILKHAHWGLYKKQCYKEDAAPKSEQDRHSSISYPMY
ncbi:hypothetical protein SAMN04488505_102738 [Chitinophaga rupis]|uniref:Uncharacterized protein n=1 Tax=Chitinophaga rupis TaxID=573321 RepID=A0A1H7RUJ6_9BACT|nr:hypothetical protein SAMN04488505_102738 [Chitinophaga rupis]